MNSQLPYHEGEHAVQDRLNVSAAARATQRVIRNSLPEGASSFLAHQSMVVIGSRDVEGHVWASIVFASPGFLTAKDAHTVEIDLSRTAISGDDPLWSNLSACPEVGLLVIDLSTRKRLRINGRVSTTRPKLWSLDIVQAYANCPRYIQRRELVVTNETPISDSRPMQYGTMLAPAQTALIRNADTFFVASAHPQCGLDASHRGGAPGFVHVLTPTRLLIPDFPGNNMYNTLGNFYTNPQAGLIFIDFNQHRLLQLTGSVKIIWNHNQPVEETGGTQRYWEFNCEKWRESPIQTRVGWTFKDYSPFNPLSRPAFSNNVAVK